MTTILFWQVLFVLLATLAGVWAATQYAADALGYSTRLGEPWAVILGLQVYAPWSIFEWWFAYEAYAPDVFDRAGLIASSGGLFGLVAAIVGSIFRARQSQRATTYGSSHWARRKDLRKAGLLGTTGVFLGQISGSYVRHSGPEHVMAFAPTRSGKGVGLVVPTLLSWPHSAVIHDIKGENWQITSGWRRTFSRCVRFDPTDPASVRFNPLLEVRKGDNEVRDAMNIADILIDPEGVLPSRNHWQNTAYALLVATILHVLYAEKNKSLTRLAELLTDPKRPVLDALKMMMQTNHIGTDEEPEVHPVIASLAREVVDKWHAERSGVISTTLAFLLIYRDPIIAKVTSTSDWQVSDFVDGDRPLSLYLTVPPSDISRTKPLMRLILNQVGRRLTEKLPGPEQRQVLMMLDEFPALGRLDFFESALSFMAGYGLRAFLIAQSLNQVEKAYGPNNSILDNCHIRVAFATNDERTARRISDALGTKTEMRAVKNFAGHRLAPWLSHTMVSRQETARQLLTPGEVMQLPPDDELVMVAGMPPARAKKLRYFQDRNFTKRLLSPPSDNVGEGGSPHKSEWDGRVRHLHADLIAATETAKELKPELNKPQKTEEGLQAGGDEQTPDGQGPEEDLFGQPVIQAEAFDELTDTGLMGGARE